jgi:hypothetical protein
MSSNLFDDVYPATGDADLDWDAAEEVPAEILERFAEKLHPRRALALAVGRIHGKGKFAIRQRDGRTYMVPRRPKQLGSGSLPGSTAPPGALSYPSIDREDRTMADKRHCWSCQSSLKPDDTRCSVCGLKQPDPDEAEPEGEEE